MFLNKIRNIFVSRSRTQNLCTRARTRANGETFVSATMCSRLPGPLLKKSHWEYNVTEWNAQKVEFKSNCDD